MLPHDIIDIHAHVLFGSSGEMDDGSNSLEESLAMLELAYQEGVRTVFATPHYGRENGYAPDAGLIRERFVRLKEAASRRVPEMDLFLGTEWYCADDLSARIEAGKAYTMNGTKYVLMEFLEWGEHTEKIEIMLDRLARVQSSGYIPVLAHAERYKSLRACYDSFVKIRQLGVLIQVNAYDLFLNQSDDTRGAAQFLAKERMIDFLGSDMHGLPPKRAPLMRAGVQWLYENTDAAYADAVVHGNAERLLIQGEKNT